MSDNNKIRVEIWSDMMCPFCYIGKRNFEQAVNQFEAKKSIEVIWKSFQLDPSIPEKIEPKQNVYQYLAERKGMSLEASEQMHENVVSTAARAGLTYNFDKAIIANSFAAHRVLQLAKSREMGDASEERFFRAYFTEGRDLADRDTLLELGQEIGLSADDVEEALRQENYAAQVLADVAEARQLGVNGVPFFVFNREYAVSGAQPPEVFLQVLEKITKE